MRIHNGWHWTSYFKFYIYSFTRGLFFYKWNKTFYIGINPSKTEKIAGEYATLMIMFGEIQWIG